MKRILCLFLSSLLIFCGCASSNSSATLVGSQVGAGNAIEQEEKTTLNLSMRSAATLNPLLNEEETVDRVLKLVYEPFVSIDATGKPVPNIAESWYYTEESRVLNVKIKQGLTWHNGSPITADDVVFSINTLKQCRDTAVYAVCAQRIMGAEKTAADTVAITFFTPDSNNLYALSFPIISASYYAGEDVAESEKNMAPMGNGIYAFGSYTQAKELRLKATANSFHDTPKIQTVVVNITSSNDTDVFSFEQGMIDCLLADATVLGSVNLEENSRSFLYTANYFDFLGFQFSDLVLSDLNVRKAIAYALPKDSILEGVYLSNAVSAETPVNPDSWLNSLSEETYGYDLKTAREYLAAAGFSAPEGKTVQQRQTENGTETLTFSILVNEENTKRVQAARRIGESLNSIGFLVTIDAVDYATYVQRLENGEFQMFLGGWELSFMPDFGYLFETGASHNYGGFSSANMDSLIAAYRLAIGEKAMTEAMAALQQAFLAELPYVGIAFRKEGLFLSDDIGGVAAPTEFHCFSGMEQWYFDTTQ